MIILDTNVLSALMSMEVDAAVVKWLDRQPRSSVWTTTITLMEIGYGLEILPAGRRRERMSQELEAVLREDIEGRYAAFDADAAAQAAALMSARKARGRPVGFRDTMIAGIVLSRNAVLATRNVSDFSDLGSHVIDPWSQSA